MMRPQPSPMSDQDRIARILTRYGDDPDVQWLVERFEPRQCRIKRRDALTRAALQEHFPDKLTLSAKALDRALSAYALSNWPLEQHLSVLPDGASPRHCALHAILRANGGKPLGWRQITNICAVAKKGHQLQSANVTKVS
jgi:hypothetical protein